MYKFYCPKCAKNSDNVFIDSTSQATVLPKQSEGELKDQSYLLHFICCKNCNTIVSTIAIETNPWIKE